MIFKAGFVTCVLICGCLLVVMPCFGLVKCKQTPGKVSSNNEFAVVNKSNNLISRPGDTGVAVGKIIYISGKIMDVNCIPVPGAKVVIFHANSTGRPQLNANGSEDEDWDPNFLGLGTAITDNIGNYSFITIYPGEEGGSKPHVHFVIDHKDFVPFETVMNFSVPDVSRNHLAFAADVNKDLLELIVAKKLGDNHYKFDVVMGGTNQRLHY